MVFNGYADGKKPSLLTTNVAHGLLLPGRIGGEKANCSGQ
jgi:hypothetical protein